MPQASAQTMMRTPNLNVAAAHPHRQSDHATPRIDPNIAGRTNTVTSVTV